jgi:hypothetical protein
MSAIDPKRRRKNDMKKKIGSKKDESPDQLIDERIEELDDWRGEMLSRLRALIKQADPKWSRSGSGEGSRCGHTTD